MNTNDVKNTLSNAIPEKAKTAVKNVMENENHEEGRLTATVEDQTAKLPSMTWLGFAVGSMAVSAGFQILNPKSTVGTFIGQWAPCFLMIGLYNKLVKVESDLGDARNTRTSSSNQYSSNYGAH